MRASALCRANVPSQFELGSDRCARATGDPLDPAETSHLVCSIDADQEHSAAAAEHPRASARSDHHHLDDDLRSSVRLLRTTVLVADDSSCVLDRRLRSRTTRRFRSTAALRGSCVCLVCLQAFTLCSWLQSIHFGEPTSAAERGGSQEDQRSRHQIGKCAYRSGAQDAW